MRDSYVFLPPSQLRWGPVVSGQWTVGSALWHWGSRAVKGRSELLTLSIPTCVQEGCPPQPGSLNDVGGKGTPLTFFEHVNRVRSSLDRVKSLGFQG